jgi:hypothetical protein
VVVVLVVVKVENKMALSADKVYGSPLRCCFLSFSDLFCTVPTCTGCPHLLTFAALIFTVLIFTVLFTALIFAVLIVIVPNWRSSLC